VAVVSASEMSARAAFDILFDRQHRASPFWMQVTREMEGLGVARQPQPISIETKLSSATKKRCSRTKGG
jgi:hypothetical protein